MPGRTDAGSVRWALYGLALFGLFAAWSLSGPLFSVPDEPAHVVKAAAVVRGQLGGEPGETPAGQPVVFVRIPERLADGYNWPGCYYFQADVPAGCAPTELAGRQVDVRVGTPAGAYPPLYYVLVGWPSLIRQDAVAVRAMRLLSAAVCAALLTAGAWALSTITRRSVAMAAGLIVATPMAAYLAGSVNPNGLEVAAAAATWGSALAVARRVRDDEPIGLGLGAVTVVAGATLALTRSLGPVFLAAILGLVALSVPLRPWWSALRSRRDLQVVLGALGLSVMAAMAFMVLAPAVELSAGPPVHPGQGDVEALIGQSEAYLTNMIGRFGWLDTPPPLLTELVWTVGLGALVGLALAVAGRPVLRALLLAAAATAVLPVAAQLPTIATLGMPWQGRYTLPLAVGVPMLAVLGLAERAVPGPLGVTTGRRHVLVAALAVTAAVGHVAALWWVVRRYATGLHGSLDLLADGQWIPPAGYVGVIGLAVTSCAVMVACALVPDRRRA